MPEMHQDRIALDRGSVRTIDQDGHLHVALNPISKANVCPYYGSEIPDADKLGLKPGTIYQLYRDPDELRKGAETFDGKPLLLTHKPQSADEHSRQLTVGAIKNPEFSDPYLMAEIVVWDAEGIEVIRSGEQKQLSCGYRYVADMRPGVANGVPYDGRMTQIQGNHVALVETGRAGSDVVVGDSAIQLNFNQEPKRMDATPLPRSVRVAALALDTYLRPKLAKDAKLDLGALLTGKTGKAWATSKAQVKLGLDAAVKDKLAKDADISDVDWVLNQMDDVVGDEDPMPSNALDEDDDDDDDDKKKKKEAEDEEEDDKKKEACDEDDDEDDKKKEAKDKAAKDKAAKDKSAKDKSAKDKSAKDAAMITKSAMDAALADVAKRTEAATIAKMNGIREAEQVVREWGIELAIPQESATDVYRVALDGLGVNVKGLHPDALKPILMAQRKPSNKEPGWKPRIATDSAAVNDEYLKMFPNANRLMGA